MIVFCLVVLPFRLYLSYSSLLPPMTTSFNPASHFLSISANEKENAICLDYWWPPHTCQTRHNCNLTDELVQCQQSIHDFNQHLYFKSTNTPPPPPSIGSWCLGMCFPTVSRHCLFTQKRPHLSGFASCDNALSHYVRVQRLVKTWYLLQLVASSSASASVY